jgi:hypothetical protein
VPEIRPPRTAPDVIGRATDPIYCLSCRR